jgi:hypothetical protein
MNVCRVNNAKQNQFLNILHIDAIVVSLEFVRVATHQRFADDVNDASMAGRSLEAPSEVCPITICIWDEDRKVRTLAGSGAALG